METHCNALPNAAQKLNVKYFLYPGLKLLPCLVLATFVNLKTLVKVVFTDVLTRDDGNNPTRHPQVYTWKTTLPRQSYSSAEIIVIIGYDINIWGSRQLCHNQTVSVAHSIASCSNVSMCTFEKPEKVGDSMAVFEQEARFRIKHLLHVL